MGFVIFLWVLFSLMIGAFADKRGRSGIGFALLAFFISPLIAFLVILLLPDLELEARREEDRRYQHERDLESLRVLAKERTPAIATSTLSVSAADEIAKLAALKDQGVLTEEEFSTRKRKILAN